MTPAGLPLWLKWVLTLFVFAALSVAALIFLHRSGEANLPAAEPDAAESQANHLGQVVTKQDQAVHRAELSRAFAPRLALEHAIRADVHTLVAQHDIAGPVQHVTCQGVSRRRPHRLPFRCQALAGGFNYPFAGVADLTARELSWCKDDSTS